MKYSVVLFDLDGTITDSSEGITASVAYALDKKGISYESKQALRHFIGPPLKEQFMKVYNLSSEQASEMVDLYREYYGVKGIYECYVYDGIEDLLKKLKENGCKVVLATSKPEKFARMILEHFSLTRYFDVISGANFDNTRTNKTDVIKYALESLKCDIDKKNVVMVGDHPADIIGAGNCCIDGIFVTYGFGNKEEALKHCPVNVSDSAYSLCEYLFN